MFGWNFDHSTWGSFHACVVWILRRLLRRLHQRRSNTAKSKCGLSGWGEHLKIIPRTSFHRNCFGKKNKKWSILTFFLAMTVTWPPPQPSQGGFLGQIAGVILWGSPCRLTWQVDLTSCHLSIDLKRGRRRGWQINLTSATCQVPLALKRKCRTLSFLDLRNASNRFRLFSRDIREFRFFFPGSACFSKLAPHPKFAKLIKI